MSRGRHAALGRILLLGLLAVAVFWVVHLRRGQDAPPDGDSGRLVPGLEGLQRATFHSGTDSIVVSAEEDDSWIIHPIRDRVDPFYMAELRRLLESLQPNRVLRDTVAAQAGLVPPRSSVRLRMSDGQTFTVEVGDTVPIGSQIYARVRPGQEGVLLLDLFPVRRYLTPELETLRDKRAAVLGGGPVDSIAVIVPEKSLRAARIRADLWESASPRGLRLDPPSINRVIQDFRTPSIQGFAPAGEGLEDLGLRPPRAIWILYQRSRVESVLVGTSTADGRSVNILPAGRTLPAYVDAGLEDDLTGGWPALADLSLLETSPQEWTSVLFLDASDSTGFVRLDGKWLRSPRGEAPERPGALARDLENLGRLRWREYPWPEAPPPPALERLSLEIRTASRAETLELAAPLDSLGWARSSSHPVWGRISPLAWRVWSYRAANPTM